MTDSTVFCMRTSRGRVRYTGPAGSVAGYLKRPLHCHGEVFPAGQLVVPLHVTLNAACLIELFLVDIAVTPTWQAAVDGVGHPSCANHHSGSASLRVVQVRTNILDAHVDMNQDNLRLAVTIKYPCAAAIVTHP